MSPQSRPLSAALGSVTQWQAAGATVLAMLALEYGGPDSYFGVDADALSWFVLGLFVVWFFFVGPARGRSAVETDPDTPPRSGEHYRPTGGAIDTAVDDGVYRVVGTGGGVTLLRVTDADGRRAHTGEVRRVDRAALDADFEPADDPDAGLTPLATVRNRLDGLYWNVRKFL